MIQKQRCVNLKDLSKIIAKKQEQGVLNKNIINIEATANMGTLKEEEDLIINQVLEEVWNNFNDDGNEHLDKDEMEKFIYITLIENGDRNYKTINDLRRDEEFQTVFAQFDDDGSGTITKDELAEFIKKVSGI